MDRLRQLASLMQQDFCPSANRWVYWMKNPFWSILLSAIVAGVCAFYLNPWIWIPAGLLTAVAIGGLLIPIVAIRGISLRVDFDVRRAEFGHPVLVRLSVRNRLWIPVWGLSVIRGLVRQSDESDSGSGVLLARVPARSSVEYSWAFCPTRRGVYPHEQVEVETGFPFGLTRASRPATVHGSLVVWPQTIALEGVPDAAVPFSEEEFDPHRAGDFGDSLGTRPFREGDSLRRVHWAQSARRQTLIVTERQAPRSSTVRVVVDLRESAHAGQDEELTERLISVAASICRTLDQQYSRVECLIGSKIFRLNGARREFFDLMDAFATAEVVGDDLPANRGGVFEIVVTTSQGLQSVGNRRWTVVVEDGHSDPIVAEGPHAIVLPATANLAEFMPRSWRTFCHVS